MPHPVLTPEQRLLLDYVNRYKISEGRSIDSNTFGKLMLRPEYVNLVRKSVPEVQEHSGDSASFYDRYRSPIELQAPLTGEYLPPKPTTASSREGSYDTLHYPAYGDIPAHDSIQFNPSVMQRVKDGVADVKSFGSQLVDKLQAPSAVDDKPVAGQPGFGRALLVGTRPDVKLQSLYDYIAGKPSRYDAISGAAAKPAKPTRLQKDGL